MFRYIYKKVLASGGTERLVQEYRQSEVVLGRGGESHVLISGQRIAPTHAKLSWNGSELFVSDLGSLAGVRVNNRRVSYSAVKSGDSILLGDIEIEVSIENGVVELRASSVEDGAHTDAQQVERSLEQLKVEGYLPPMRHILIGCAVLSFIAFGLYPLVAKDFSPWNSGPVSNAHSLIAQDCQKCHATPFTPVQDRECLYCHAMSEHAHNIADFTKSHPKLEKRCAECHMEHNGDHGLILKDAEFCQGCHAKMTEHNPKAGVLNVPDLKGHPQFRISVKAEDGSVTRVSLDDAAHAVDPTQIKLNHEVHLKAGLRGKDGPVNLTCKSCHEPDESFKNLRPIAFDKHCRDCHSLGFDERLPDSQVPHGDSEAVYPALFTEYTRLITIGDSSAAKAKPSDPARLFPSEKTKDATTPINVASVVQSARDAERQLFTRTGCFLCHSFKEKGAAEQTDTNSHFAVAKPQIPTRWLTGSSFSHGAHEEFQCDSCHEKARKSSKTEDVLLPKVQLCRECHAQDETLGYIKSGCAECHSYHDTIGFPGEKKQSIVDYLRTLTR